MKILIDMNLSPLWAGFLCAHGHAGTHWSEVGSARATDREILDYAAANGMVVLTHDLDFGLLLAARKARGPSVIQVRTQDVLPSAVGASKKCIAFLATASPDRTGCSGAPWRVRGISRAGQRKSAKAGRKIANSAVPGRARPVPGARI